MGETFKLHEQLQILRKQKGITQEELASHFNVTNQSVSKWESGQSCPDIELLPKLAAFFGVSIDELLGYVPVCSVENLYLKIRALFEALPEEDTFKTAFILSAVLHEAAFTKGFKYPAPWKQKNRIIEGGYANWGYSGTSEPEGFSAMTSGLVIMGCLPELKFPGNTEIKRMYAYLARLADKTTLTVLFSLYKQTYITTATWCTAEEVANATKINVETVQTVIDKMAIDDFIYEKIVDGKNHYRISGPFETILPIFNILTSKPLGL